MSSLSPLSTSYPIDFHPPTHFGEDGQPIESDKEPLLTTDLTNGSSAFNYTSSKGLKMLPSWLISAPQPMLKPSRPTTASPTSSMRSSSSYPLTADADLQIRDRYIDVINTCGRAWADLCMHLANTKKKASDKLEMLAVLQKRQQFAATAFERFMSLSNKGKAAASQGTGSKTQPAAGARDPTQAPATTNWGPELLVSFFDLCWNPRRRPPGAQP